MRLLYKSMCQGVFVEVAQAIFEQNIDDAFLEDALKNWLDSEDDTPTLIADLFQLVSDHVEAQQVAKQTESQQDKPQQADEVYTPATFLELEADEEAPKEKKKKGKVATRPAPVPDTPKAKSSKDTSLTKKERTRENPIIRKASLPKPELDSYFNQLCRIYFSSSSVVSAVKKMDQASLHQKPLLVFNYNREDRFIDDLLQTGRPCKYFFF